MHQRKRGRNDTSHNQEKFGKPDAWKLARPVWGWGRGANPRSTPHDIRTFDGRLWRGVVDVVSGG